MWNFLLASPALASSLGFFLCICCLPRPRFGCCRFCLCLGFCLGLCLCLHLLFWRSNFLGLVALSWWLASTWPRSFAWLFFFASMFLLIFKFCLPFRVFQDWQLAFWRRFGKRFWWCIRFPSLFVVLVPFPSFLTFFCTFLVRGNFLFAGTFDCGFHC